MPMTPLPAERAFAVAKTVAFSTPVLRPIATWYRARTVENNYRRISRRYDALPSPGIDTTTLLEKRSGECLSRLRRRSGPLRILYMGTDEFQDTGGILQALGETGEVTPFTQADGRYGQLAANGDLSFALARPNGLRLADLLAAGQRAGRPYDLVIGQMWGGYIDTAALQRAREEFGCLVVNIAMDDRHTFAGIRKLGRTVGGRGLIPHVDLVATAAPEAVGWYLKEGCPATYFPEASAPDLYRPMPELGKAHDVCFVGANYGIRARLVRALRAAGIRVTTHGHGWPEGRLAVSEAPRLFAASKVVLGVGAVGHSSRLLALKMRDFDGPMSGSCYVTQDNPDLHALYEVGREIVVYHDEADLVRQVRRLLADDAAREAIASRGRARAHAMHTWQARFTDLLDLLDGARRALHRGAAKVEESHEEAPEWPWVDPDPVTLRSPAHLPSKS